jgi:mannosyltransferase OCH1-like enzyme
MNNKIADNVGIPKIIHQTWKNDVIPEHWKTSPVNWKRYHPDWEYILWTDEMNRNFISDKFPWFLGAYDKFEYGIQRADAVRYAILYVYGGIYSDLDIEPSSNINDLFPNRGAYLVFSKNDMGANVATNCFMASTPNENFWIECLTEMMKPYKWWWWGKHMKVLASTGPNMVQRVLNRYPQTVNLLPRTTLMPCGVCDPLPCTNEFSRLHILQGSSWIAWDTKIYNFLMCKFKYILIFLVLILILWLLIKSYDSTGLSINKHVKYNLSKRRRM